MALPKTTGNGPYEYPLVRDDSYASKITFQAIKVNPPSVQSKFLTSQTADEVGQGINEEALQLAVESNPPADGTDTVAGVQGLSTEILTGEKASIYVPIAFAVNDSLQYEQKGTSAAAAAALMRGGTVEEATFDAIKQAGKGLFDFFRNQGQTASRIAAVRVANAVGTEGVASAVGQAARVTMNPNIRTTFQGVNIREFTFAFEFLPKSAQESVMVKNMIKFFRYHSYPEELVDIGSFSVAYSYPNLFRIKLLSHDGGIFKNIGTPIKMCYCTAVTHTYNPTAQVLHADGSPVKIDLSLTFTEFKPLSRKDILNEDDDIFYNYETGYTPDQDYTSPSDAARQNQGTPDGAIGDNFGGGE